VEVLVVHRERLVAAVQVVVEPVQQAMLLELMVL
jgi:hypothetical protein